VFFARYFYFINLLFQTEGAIKINKGKNSSLPATMQNERTIFDSGVNAVKFPAGPTAPSPGPTLLSEVKTAVALVIISLPSVETIITDTVKTAK